MIPAPTLSRRKGRLQPGDAVANFVFMTMILQSNFYTDVRPDFLPRATSSPSPASDAFRPAHGVIADRTNTRWAASALVLLTAVP